MNDDPRQPTGLPHTEAHIPRDASSTKAHHESQSEPDDTRKTDKHHVKPPDEIPDIPGYETLEFIARGGMGYVVKARHQMLDRLVAVKLPLPGRVADDDDHERFMREARSAARLQHPHICPIHEVGEINKGQPYIVMAYIQGTTLGEWATSHEPTAHAMCALFAPLSRAVHYAHQHEVLHRDIKPSNVMVSDEDGRAILMDFGLAKELTQERSDLTHTGQVMGTPAYMSPEQAAGNTGRIGPPSDVYALGAVLYHLITGQSPFTGSVGEILHKVQAEAIVPPRKLKPRTHRDLETIILKAMAREPMDRYESAAALADDLERFCAGESILARRERLLKKSIRHVRRHPVAIVAVVALLVLSAIAGHYVVRVRHVAGLRDAIQSKIDSGQFSQLDVQSVEPLLDQLTSLDRQQGASHRIRVYRSYAASVEELIRKPDLSTDEFKLIEDDLTFLELRDKESHSTLLQLLQKRLSQWQPLFDLTAPFDNLDASIMGDEVRAEKEGLVSHGAVVLTNTACQGNVRLMARFDDNWAEADQLGLYLGAKENEIEAGYLFRISASHSAAGDSPAQSDASADARQQDVKVAAQILRDGRLLREEMIDVAEGPLQVTVSRHADHLVMQVNDLPPIDFFDTFSLPNEKGRRFGIQWPVKARLVGLQASALSMSQEASPLERGDDLYGRGQFAAALAEYEKQVTVHGKELVHR